MSRLNNNIYEQSWKTNFKPNDWRKQQLLHENLSSDPNDWRKQQLFHENLSSDTVITFLTSSSQSFNVQ